MNLTTLQHRIKDETTAKHLTKMGYSVNFVWNFCNQSNSERWGKFRKTFSNYDLHKLTAGCAKDLGLHSQTLQAVCDEYAKAGKQFKKVKLNWRSRKRSLGWVPFKASAVKIENDTITYGGRTFRFWLSHPIDGKVRFGSFAQDSKGHWFVNLVIESKPETRSQTGKEVGCDLGLKTIATLSDGVELSRENLTRRFEEQLAIAQRAKKKRRVTAIHRTGGPAKIRNKRKDWNHKATTRLVRTYDKIVVGNVSSKKLMKTRMAKSVADAGWLDFKTMLEYKAVSLGCVVKEVNESFSTVTCSDCKERTGPKGQADLRVREWVCSSCGSMHLRDVNAAKNILSFSVQDIVRH